MWSCASNRRSLSDNKFVTIPVIWNRVTSIGVYHRSNGNGCTLINVLTVYISHMVNIINQLNFSGNLHKPGPDLGVLRPEAR